MNVKKSLENRIRGWFPQEPILKKTFQVQGMTKSSNSKSTFWENTSRFVSCIVFIEILILEIVQFDFPWNFYINLSIIAFFIGLTGFLLRRKQGLNDWYSGILFVNALAIIGFTGVLFWFTIINFTGYAIISIVILSVFSLPYALVEKLKKTDSLPQGGRNKHKIISTIFVLAGIILLVFSLALASHVEQRLGAVEHNENFLRQTFYLTQQIPDTTLSANLTTQDGLAFGIFPASVVPHSSNYSSIDFSISYQPAFGEPLVKVYERNNISSHTADGSGGWSVTQNGTYILNLHYNYNGTTHVNENIGRYWSTTEPVPTTLYTPLLATYMVPTLIIASALLIGSIAIPIQQVLKIKSMNNKQYSDFANSPQS
jgi:hypothetical protein